MTELPEEEAWKEHSCKSGCGNNYSITDLGQAKVHFVAGWNAHEKAVASFLETARKEMEGKSFEQVDGAQKCNIKDCDTYGKPHGHLRRLLKLSDAIAVFGGEEEHYQEDEYQPTEQEIHDLGGER